MVVEVTLLLPFESGIRFEDTILLPSDQFLKTPKRVRGTALSLTKKARVLITVGIDMSLQPGSKSKSDVNST